MSDKFHTRPILFVDDVDATFAQVERNGLEVMLGRKELEQGTTIRTVLSTSLHDPGKLDELHRQFQKNGTKIVTHPTEMKWKKGTFELQVEDLDGNLLFFWGNSLPHVKVRSWYGAPLSLEFLLCPDWPR